VLAPTVVDRDLVTDHPHKRPLVNDLVCREPDHQRAAVGSIVLHSPAGDDACCLLFCPALKDLHIQGVEDHGDTVLITARTVATEAACPRCGRSTYTATLSGRLS
jgi:hypothetical protein